MRTGDASRISSLSIYRTPLPSGKRQMRVLFDARVISDHFPGIGRYAYHLLKAFEAYRDLELGVIFDPKASNSRFSPPWTSSARVQIIQASTPFTLRSQWELPVAIRHYAFDVYHAPYYVFPYAIPLPTVLTIHDTIPTRFPAYFPPLKRYLIRGLKFLATRKARHIITDSEATARDVQRFYHVNPQRITAIPLAPPPYFTPPLPEQVEKVRRKYSLPTCYFLYVGSSKPHKNVRLLFKVWKRSPPPCPLVLVGLTHFWHSSLPAQVRELGAVPEEDLPALYGGCRGFLFPSLYEGFGLPALEAMACGAPVIYSDIPALREVAGSAGIALPPSDVEAWGDVIERLAYDEAFGEVLKIQGLTRAAQFSWTRTAQATLEVYRRVTG